MEEMYFNPGSVRAHELMRAAEDRGWQLRRVRGSHHIYGKQGWPEAVSIPVKLHGTGTIRRIIQQLIDEERSNG